MIFYLLFCFIASFPLFSATIPTYPINTVTPGKVSFANGAAFEIVIDDCISVLDWDGNDPITFSLPIATRLPTRISLTAGSLAIRFPVSLNNTLKNSEAIGYLSTAASNQSLGTRLIQSIDMGIRKITLDDSSEWYFQSEDDVTVKAWLPGDFILLGSHFFFDASVINASCGTLIGVME